MINIDDNNNYYRQPIITCNKKSKSVSSVFDKIAEKYVNYFGDDWEFINEIKEFVSYLKTNSTVIDLGCGSGYITNFLCNQNLNGIGIDISSEMINIAKQRYPGVKFILDDFVNIENYFEENSVDGVIAIYSLYFIPREYLNKVFKALSIILKKEGKFLFITEKGDGEDYVKTPLMMENNVNEKLYVNYYTKDQLEQILKQNNFSIDYFKQKSIIDEKEISDDERYIVLATNKKD